MFFKIPGGRWERFLRQIHCRLNYNPLFVGVGSIVSSNPLKKNKRSKLAVIVGIFRWKTTCQAPICCVSCHVWKMPRNVCLDHHEITVPVPSVGLPPTQYEHVTLEETPSWHHLYLLNNISITIIVATISFSAQATNYGSKEITCCSLCTIWHNMGASENPDPATRKGILQWGLTKVNKVASV